MPICPRGHFTALADLGSKYLTLATSTPGCGEVSPQHETAVAEEDELGGAHAAEASSSLSSSVITARQGGTHHRAPEGRGEVDVDARAAASATVATCSRHPVRSSRREKTLKAEVEPPIKPLKPRWFAAHAR